MRIETWHNMYCRIVKKKVRCHNTTILVFFMLLSAFN
nr:MAG TPA: hypothetical protein [Caudoviricetes sp.]